MVELEMSVSDQKIQGLRDRLQGEDDSLLREIAIRRRSGRAANVHASLTPLLRGEAVPYRQLRDELDSPYGLEQMTPRFGITVTLLVIIPLLCILGTVVWTMLR